MFVLPSPISSPYLIYFTIKKLRYLYDICVSQFENKIKHCLCTPLAARILLKKRLAKNYVISEP